MKDFGFVIGEITEFEPPDPEALDRISPREIRETYRDVCRGQISEYEAVTRTITAYRGRSLTRDEVTGSTSETMELLRLGRSRQALLLSRLSLAAADATGARLGDKLYDDSSHLFILAGIYVLHEMLAGPLYLAVTHLADEKLAHARARGDEHQLGLALDLAAGARSCLLLEGRDLPWWSDRGNWRQSLRGSIEESVLEGPNEEVLRMPDVLPELKKYQELLRELIPLTELSGRDTNLCAFVHVSRTLGEHSNVPHQELVAMAREAVDVATSELGRVEALQLLDHLSGVRDLDRERPVYTGSLAAEQQEHGSVGAVSTYRGVAWLALRLGRHGEARALTEAYLQLDVANAPEDEWLQALDVAVHCYDNGTIVCEKADELSRDHSALLASIPRSLGPFDQATAHLHAALHAADLPTADAILSATGRLGQLPQAHLLLRLTKYTRGTVALRSTIERNWTANLVRLRIGPQASED